jgi:hypothetical protein
LEVGATAAERVEPTRACAACGTRAVKASNTRVIVPQRFTD